MSRTLSLRLLWLWLWLLVLLVVIVFRSPLRLWRRLFTITHCINNYLASSSASAFSFACKLLFYLFFSSPSNFFLFFFLFQVLHVVLVAFFTVLRPSWLLFLLFEYTDLYIKVRERERGGGGNGGG